MGPSDFVDGMVVQANLYGPVYVLQWGRRISSTETGRPADAERGGVQASMEPSAFVDGDSPSWLAGLVDAVTGFNGAVGFRRRGRRGRDTNRIRLPGASMGPSTFVDGDKAWAADIGEKLPLQWGHRLSSTEMVGQSCS